MDTAGTIAVYSVFVMGIPLVRANWPQFQQQMQANGVTLVYGMRNTYETTIRFQKQVGYVAFGRLLPACRYMCGGVLLLNEHRRTEGIGFSQVRVL